MRVGEPGLRSPAKMRNYLRALKYPGLGKLLLEGVFDAWR